MTLSERGARLRQERLRRKLSLYRLAQKVGVHPNSVALAERGAASEAMIAKIAAELGLAQVQRA